MTMKTKETKDKKTEGRRSKSPARGRASSRSRSRSRSRSPGRTPVKASTKSEPAVRVTRKSDVVVTTTADSVTKKTSKKAETASEKKVAAVEKKVESPSKSVQYYESVVRTSRKTEKLEPTPGSRQSARLAEKVTSSVLTERKTRLGEARASNQDVVDAKLKATGPTTGGFGQVIHSVIGLLFHLAILFGLTFCCTLTKCNFDRLPSVPLAVSAYVDLKAFLVVAGFLGLQVVLAFVPIGVQRSSECRLDGTKFQYRCNGLFAFVASAILLGMAYCWKYPVFEMISQKFLALFMASLAAAFVFGTFCYIRARHLPSNKLAPAGNTGWFISDFIMGRELNPRIGNLDLKMFSLVNVALLGEVALMAVIVMEAFQKGKLYGGLALETIFMGFSTLDFLVFQSSLVNSMMMTNEGIGLLFSVVMFAAIPFAGPGLMRYLLLNPRTLDYPTLIGLSLLFVVGYAISRWSDYIKDKFRQNPYHPRFSSYQTIPTASGKPLLASGLWGWCRHPNYFGQLVTVVAMSAVCGVTCPLTYICPLLQLLTFVHRVSVDGAACEQKHGTVAWSRYCQRVRKRLIPYIY